MATTEKGKEPSQKAAKKEEQKAKKQSTTRRRRHKPYQTTAVVVAKETALLPEPLRASVVAMAQAIIRFFQRAWLELTAAEAADPAPRLLPPGNRSAGKDE